MTASQDPDTSDLDSGWGDPEAEEPAPAKKEAAPPSKEQTKLPPSRRATPPARPLAPTLPDFDPTSLEEGGSPDRKHSRPTLPVINPLRFDIPDDED